MSDYFDRVEQGLGEAVRRRAHVPWYVRLKPRLSRPLVVAVASLLVAGSAYAATRVFQTGTPVGAGVLAVPNAYEGVAIPSSVRLLALRVPDPSGGPPWGLRVLKTTRGLMCLQLGRIVDGQIGVLGQDGVFNDDGRFHPLSVNYLNGTGFGCGTEDARGDAFLNGQDHALPASGLQDGERYASGGCYGERRRRSACPRGELRDVYFGLLGPDAVSVTHATPSGGVATTPTSGPDGAYLIVLPHETARCSTAQLMCRSNEAGSTGGPQLNSELDPSQVIRAVNYRSAPSCRLLSGAQLTRLQAAQGAKFRAVLRVGLPAVYRTVYSHERFVPGSMSRLTAREDRAFEALRAPYTRASRGPSCPELGYVAPRVSHVTSAQLATPLSVHLEPSRFYCERGMTTEPCPGRVPAGFKRIDMQGAPPELLVVVDFTARVAVPNYDSHYEINMTDPKNPSRPHCSPGGSSSFGPTQTDLRAGQRVRFTQFVDRDCPGVSHVSVGFVTTTAPSGSMPVPGLPGQSAEIPVGQANFSIP